MLILLWEKYKEKPIQWKWIGAFFLFCLFVSCFQAWIDEHHNSQILVSQKADLAAEKNALNQKLDIKQAEVDWLRDHRVFELPTGKADPLIGKALDANARAMEQLAGREKNRMDTIKKRALEVSSEMLTFLGEEEKKRLTIPVPTFAPASASADERQRLWNEETARMSNAYMQIEGEIQSKAVNGFRPTAMAILEQIRDEGEKQTGIKDEEITLTVRDCQISHSYTIKECATKLGVIARKMR